MFFRFQPKIRVHGNRHHVLKIEPIEFQQNIQNEHDYQTDKAYLKNEDFENWENNPKNVLFNLKNLILS